MSVTNVQHIILLYLNLNYITLLIPTCILMFSILNIIFNLQSNRNMRLNRENDFEILTQVLILSLKSNRRNQQ